MTRWSVGANQVSDLIRSRHLQRIAGDPKIVRALLASAQRHVESARRNAIEDPEAALAIAYDAARKSATALLAHQGLRPTTAGGHFVVIEAIRAQFPKVPGLSSLDRLRRRRNQAEYPDPRGYDPISSDEASDAINVACDCIASAEKLLVLDELGVFVEEA